jgi:hypothetical protein
METLFQSHNSWINSSYIRSNGQQAQEMPFGDFLEKATCWGMPSSERVYETSPEL